MGQAKANRQAMRLAEESAAALRREWDQRTHCGEGATGDPYCDVECQRERGHDGPHRVEWA